VPSTSALNIPPRDFLEGFPASPTASVVRHHYTGHFIDDPGKCRFLLGSDDGSSSTSTARIIDNDGIHPINAGSLREGVPAAASPDSRFARPGGDWRAFNTDEFRPPRSPADWVAIRTICTPRSPDRRKNECHWAG
jgi:hypothetical protein